MSDTNKRLAVNARHPGNGSLVLPTVIDLDDNAKTYVLAAPTLPSGVTRVESVQPVISGDGTHVFAVLAYETSTGSLDHLFRWDRGSGSWDGSPTEIDSAANGNPWEGLSDVTVSDDGSRIAYVKNTEVYDETNNWWVATRSLMYKASPTTAPQELQNTTYAVGQYDPYQDLVLHLTVSGDGHWLIHDAEDFDGTHTTSDIVARNLDTNPSSPSTLVPGVIDDGGLATLDVSDGGRYVVWSGTSSFGLQNVPSGEHVFVRDRNYDNGSSSPNQTFDEPGSGTLTRYLPGLDFLGQDEQQLSLSPVRISGDGTKIARRSYDNSQRCFNTALSGTSMAQMPRIKTVDQSANDEEAHADLDVHDSQCSLDLTIDYTGERVMFLDVASYWQNDANNHPDVYSFEIDNDIWPGLIPKKKGSPGSTLDAGDPTSTTIGNFHFERTDLSAPGYGVGFSRTYNSWSSHPAGLGIGWAYTYSQRLVDGANGAKILVLPDEREVTFTPSGGSYSLPRELNGSLAADSGGYELTFQSGEVWKFDSTGVLVELRSGRGETVVASHDTDHNGRLSVVTNTSTGWKLTFGYDNGVDDLIDMVTLTNSASPGLERHVAYGYTATESSPQGSVLTAASQPYAAPTDPRGVETYTVNPRSFRVSDVVMAGVNYDNVENENFNVAVSDVNEVHVEYRSDGRVSKQVTQDGDVVSFSYNDTDHKTTVTNEGKPNDTTDDDVNTYVYSNDGDTTQINDPTPNHSQTTKTFDAHGTLKSVVDRTGTQSGMFFDDHGRLTQRATADPATGQIPTPGTDGWLSSTPGGWGLEKTDYLSSTDNRISTMTNPIGVVTKFCYGASTLNDADACAPANQGTNRVPTVTITAFDGNLSGLTANELETRTNVDSNGRVTASRDSDGVTSCTFYNSDGTVKASGQLQVATTATNFSSQCAANENDTTNLAKTSFTYDGLGQLTEKVTPALQGTGRHWTYTYWATGRVRSETDPDATTVDQAGHTTRHIYHPLGHQLAQVDQTGARTDTTIAWNQTTGCNTAGSGCRIETTTADYDRATSPVTRHQTISIYDRFGDLREQRTPNTVAGDAVTTYTYGPLSRLLSVTDPTEVKTFYDYDQEGRVTKTVNGSSLTDTTGAATETAYDKLGRATRVTKPSVSTSSAVRPVTAYVYDKLGRVVQQVDSDPTSGLIPGHTGSCARNGDGTFPVPKVGNCANYDFISHTTAYLPNGLVDKTAVLRSDTNHAAGAEAWKKNTYTPGGRLACIDTRVQDANGWIGEQSVFDAIDYTNGRVTATRHQIASLTAPLGQTKCDDSKTSTAKWAITATGYNVDGTTAWQQTPLQYAAHPTVDAGHINYRTSVTYDRLGRTFQTESPNPDIADRATNPRVTTTTCYNAGGETAATIDANNNVTAYTYYDTPGLVRGVADPRGMNPVTTQHPTTGSPCDGLSPVTDPHAGTVTYTYDERNNRTTRTAWDGDQNGTALTETFGYDKANRPTLQRAAERAGASAHFDTTTDYTITNNRLASKTTKTGVIAPNTYLTSTVDTFSPSGAVTSSVATDTNGTETTTNTYDYLGRLKKATNASGDLLLAYNQSGNITSITYPNRTQPATFAWTLEGHRTSVVYSGNFLYQSRYDPGMREIGIDLGFWGWWPYNNNTVNANNQLTRQTLTSGTTDERRYFIDDATGLQTELRQTVNATTTRWTMKYDKTGRLRYDCQATGTDGNTNDPKPICNTSTNIETSYTYDRAGQLSDATRTHVASGDPKEWVYSYGNRGTRDQQRVTTQGSPDTTVTTKYTYTDRAELCAESTSGTASACTTTSTNSSVTGYTNDSAGRRTAVDRPTGSTDQTYSYTPRNKLKSINTSGVDTINRGYDGLGSINSESRTYGSTTDTVVLVWDYADAGVPQITEGTVNGTYFSIQYSRARVDSENHFYAYDHLLNTIDTATTPASPRSYDPYGRANPAFDNWSSFNYRGELAQHGLLHLRNRDYDPTTGTFLTRDPLGEPPGTTVEANPYAYGRNDPLNMTDPLGLRATDCSRGMSYKGCTKIVEDLGGGNARRAGVPGSFDISAWERAAFAGAKNCFTADCINAVNEGALGDSLVLSGQQAGVDVGILSAIVSNEMSGYSGQEDFLIGITNKSGGSLGITNVQAQAFDAAARFAQSRFGVSLYGGSSPGDAWRRVKNDSAFAVKVTAFYLAFIDSEIRRAATASGVKWVQPSQVGKLHYGSDPVDGHWYDFDEDGSRILFHSQLLQFGYQAGPRAVAGVVQGRALIDLGDEYAFARSMRSRSATARGTYCQSGSPYVCS